MKASDLRTLYAYVDRLGRAMFRRTYLSQCRMAYMSRQEGFLLNQEVMDRLVRAYVNDTTRALMN